MMPIAWCCSRFASAQQVTDPADCPRGYRQPGRSAQRQAEEGRHGERGRGPARRCRLTAGAVDAAVEATAESAGQDGGKEALPAFLSEDDDGESEETEDEHAVMMAAERSRRTRGAMKIAARAVREDASHLFR